MEFQFDCEVRQEVGTTRRCRRQEQRNQPKIGQGEPPLDSKATIELSSRSVGVPAPIPITWRTWPGLGTASSRPFSKFRMAFPEIWKPPETQTQLVQWPTSCGCNRELGQPKG